MKYSQADLDFWLASLVQRGRDHTPGWVTVSKLLRLGANPEIRPMGHRGMPLPSAIETCQEMVEAYDPDHGRMLEGWRCSPTRAREICAKTQAHFQRYLDQFAKAKVRIRKRTGGGTMSIETTVDTMVRFVTQFDDEEKTWHYYLNGVEIPVEVVSGCALPNQQPDALR